jgi:hypothetical protein
LENIGNRFNSKHQNKGPEKEYGHGPYVIVQHQRFTAKKIKNGFQ